MRLNAFLISFLCSSSQASEFPPLVGLSSLWRLGGKGAGGAAQEDVFDDLVFCIGAFAITPIIDRKACKRKRPTCSQDG